VDLTIKLAALCELYAVMVMDCLLKGGKNCEKQIRNGSGKWCEYWYEKITFLYKYNPYVWSVYFDKWVS